MSSHSSSYSSTKRSFRRGSRRHYQSRNKDKKGENYSLREEEAKPSSLWQRILNFFGGKKASKPRERSVGVKGEKDFGNRSEIRKPEIVEVTSPRIYIGNLSFDATESDLFELFKGVGNVQGVEIVCHRQSHRSKGFAFVQMQTIDEARRAVSELHDKEYMGRKLVVSGAKALEERRFE